MQDLEKQNAELVKRVEELDAEIAILRPVVDAAKNWHLGNDHASSAYASGTTARALQEAIDALLLSERKQA